MISKPLRNTITPGGKWYVALRTVSPFIPYAAILTGMVWFSSAWLSIFLYHLGIVVVVSLANSWNLGRGLERGRDILVLIAVVVGSAAAGLIIFWLWPVIKIERLLLAAEMSNLGLSNTPWLIFIFYYFTVNPILEEIFWRGYLGSKTLSLTWNDAWFAGYHLLVLFFFAQIPWIIASFVVLAGTAWFWRLLVRRYDGLIMPILSHAAADASIIGAVFLLLR